MNADADQPLVLMTAPGGTAAFQIGGSTIDSALLTYDSSRKNQAGRRKQLCNSNLNI